MALQTWISSLGGSEGLRALGEGVRALGQAVGLGSKSVASTALPQRAAWVGLVPGVGAFLAGAALGAGAALIMAPMSGAEMRKKLREQIEQLRKQAEAGSAAPAASGGDVRVAATVLVGGPMSEAHRTVEVIDQERREPQDGQLIS